MDFYFFDKTEMIIKSILTIFHIIGKAMLKMNES